MTIQAKLISESNFYQLRDAWSLLLKRSNADQLFLSWEWQRCWWTTWGEHIKATLFIVALYEDDKLIGIVPMYKDVQKVKIGRNRTRIQYLGNHFRATPTVRTEYLGPIFDSYRSERCATCFVKFLMKDSSWDELVTCDTNITNSDSKLLHNTLKQYGLASYIWSEEPSYQISSNLTFDDYLTRLGKDTRLKLFNRRNRAFELGIHEIDLAEKEQLFFETLNYFHLERWSKPCFDERAVSFHQSFLQLLRENSNLTYELSGLSLNNDIVSLIYTIRAGDVSYNIQAGYKENLAKGISLGTLHLGFSIEKSLRNMGTLYDLLAGTGKNTDYKSHLSTDKQTIRTTSYFRVSIKNILYIVIYKSPKLIKRFLQQRRNKLTFL